MSKIPMPEPYTGPFFAGNKIIPVITTDQAQAYANAKVREALEAAADVAKQISDKYAYGYYGNEVDTADEIEAAIRALIPQQ